MKILVDISALAETRVIERYPLTPHERAGQFHNRVLVHNAWLALWQLARWFEPENIFVLAGVTNPLEAFSMGRWIEKNGILDHAGIPGDNVWVLTKPEGPCALCVTKGIDVLVKRGLCTSSFAERASKVRIFEIENWAEPSPDLEDKSDRRWYKVLNELEKDARTVGSWRDTIARAEARWGELPEDPAAEVAIDTQLDADGCAVVPGATSA